MAQQASLIDTLTASGGAEPAGKTVQFRVCNGRTIGHDEQTANFYATLLLPTTAWECYAYPSSCITDL
jgi:hypothetical protein